MRSGNIFENYSSHGFYNALAADVLTAAGAGRTIDLQNVNAVTIVFNVYSMLSAASMSTNYWKLVLQHGLASADGVSAWSNVPGSQIINSVYGGYNSTSETGVFGSVASTTDALSTAVFAVGYKKDYLHRYLRIYLSTNSAATSIGITAGAIAITDELNWPVNTPIN